MVQLDETCGSYVIAPSVEIEKTCVTTRPSSLSPLGFDENRTPRGFNVRDSSARTGGSSWLGTWNREALAKTPSKRLSGNRSQQILMVQHLQPEHARAMATNC